MMKQIQEQQAAIAAVIMSGQNAYLIPDGEGWKTIPKGY